MTAFVITVSLLALITNNKQGRIFMYASSLSIKYQISAHWLEASFLLPKNTKDERLFALL